MNYHFSIKGLDKPVIWRTLQVLLLLLLSYVIYRQLFVIHNAEEIVEVFTCRVSARNVPYLIAFLLLMPVNWLLESGKWKVLVSQFQPMTYEMSIKAILTGVCLAIVTPARLGEYGGRLLGIEKQHIPNALAANFISSVSQNMINVIIGIVALVLFNQRYEIVALDVSVVALSAISMILIGLVALFFFNDIKSALLGRFKKYFKTELNISSFGGIIVTKVFNLAFLRYSVYMLQYVLIIMFYGVTGDIVGSILGVGVIYFFQTMVPLPPILSVFARGEVAVVVWGVFTENILGILAATFTLWAINLLIPALVGYIILWRTKPFDRAS